MFDERSVLSGVLRLDQNLPNPFTGQTVIPFCLPEACVVEWEISDAGGRVIQQLKRSYPAGEQVETFWLNEYSGVYFYRMKTPHGVITKKMVIAG